MTKTETVQRLHGRCPHCQGTYIVDAGVNTCLACSRTIEGVQDMRLYYDFNKKEIMTDIKQLRRPAALKKWGIPGGSINRLLTRWAKNGTPEPEPALREDPEEKSLVEKLAEARIEIAMLRGYQQACRDLMQGRKFQEVKIE
ncbi:hypothetical protein LCGC14_0915800 [marine sediment metagenome]|uniref:Uncharacterized protein n=1 Tax=marine sediment metagenome TaxID=412755 RepID=A0A0F9RZ25_9ZZZZ